MLKLAKNWLKQHYTESKPLYQLFQLVVNDGIKLDFFLGK